VVAPYGELTNVTSGSAPSIIDRSYTISADVEVPAGGAEGMLVTQGGRFGGYGLYLLHGRACVPPTSSMRSGPAGRPRTPLGRAR